MDLEVIGLIGWFLAQVGAGKGLRGRTGSLHHPIGNRKPSTRSVPKVPNILAVRILASGTLVSILNLLPDPFQYVFVCHRISPPFVEKLA
jgi:hypothetical protein